jgi:hypothetical protein
MIFNDYECYLLLKSANHVLKDFCHLKAVAFGTQLTSSFCGYHSYDQ